MTETPAETATAKAPMEGASEADLGAAMLQGQADAEMPLGSAHVDITELLAQINAYKDATDQRIAALEAEKRAAGGTDPLTGVVSSLTDLVATHAAHTPQINHGEVLNLVSDLGEAASEAVKTGVGANVEKIGAKVWAWLTRNPPANGEQPYYRQALDFAGPHLADALEHLTPPPSASALISSRAPATVVPGNVVAG